MKILWSPLAVKRLEESSDYIAYDSPAQAKRWIDAILTKVELLKTSPEMGRVVSEFGIAAIREIIFGNYRIIYRCQEESIRILTVRSFKQILPGDDVK